MKVVADTNVVVSGLLWIGKPGQLLEAAAYRRVTLYTSPQLVTELRATLSYARLTKPIARSGLTVDELIARYTNVAIVVEPTTVPRVIIQDADDDHIIAAAVAAEADLIVSGDIHLLALGTHQGVRIVTPAEALNLIAPAG